MKKYLKYLVAIRLVSLTVAANSVVAHAADTLFPQVGVQTIVQDITEDEAKWAYAKELGTIDSEDLRLMSAIIWCEAGNQCEAGRQAIGIVVMNRIADEANFGSTVEEVIYWPGQFRPRTDGRLNKALAMYDNNELPQDCIDAAWYALLGNKIVTYNGQEIDMSEYLYFAREWKNAKIRIEDHDFR